MEKEQLVSLVSRAQSGDNDALNELFNAFYNDLYYFALKTVKDDELALDVTQEAFVEIINTLSALKEPAAFVTWAKQITYHQCTRYFKKKKDVIVDEDDEGNSVFDNLKEENAEFIPDEALDKADFRNTILAILDELSEEQRSATMMYYFDEMSVKEIAEVQAVSEGTVKSRLNYSRKAIKASVEEYEKKNGIKLHAVPCLPLIKWIFEGVFEGGIAAPTAATLAGGITAATGTTVAVSTAAASTATAVTATAATVGIAAKIAALPIVTKIVAASVAAAVVIGGATTAVIVSKPKNDKLTSSTVAYPQAKPEPSLRDETALTYLTEIGDTCPKDATFIRGKKILESGSPFPEFQKGDILKYYDYTYYYEDENPTDKNAVIDGEKVYCPWTAYLNTETSIYPPVKSINGFYVHPKTYKLSEKGVDTTPSQDPSQSSSQANTSTAPTVSKGQKAYNYVIPQGHTYKTADGKTYTAGESVSAYPISGDELICDDYTYKYKYHYSSYYGDGLEDAAWQKDGTAGWGVRVNDTTKKTYAPILDDINHNAVTSLRNTFAECKNMTTAPDIPVNVTDLGGTFYRCESLTASPVLPNAVYYMTATFEGCKSLTKAPVLPVSITDLTNTFVDCSSLKTAPKIPSGVISMTNTFVGCSSLKTAPVLPNKLEYMICTFNSCTSLTEAPVIPESVVDMQNAFTNCRALTTAPVIPKNVANLTATFTWCESLKGNVTINAQKLTDDVIEGCFEGTMLDITLSGSCPYLEKLAATSSNGNVKI